MKKIIAVMVALMFAAVLFNINVSADTSSVDGGITSGGGGRGGSRTEYGNGLNVFFETLEDFTDGNITYDEFISKTSTILEEYAGEFCDRAGITLINDIKSQVNDYVTKYGTNAPMYIYDSISDILNSYETTETMPTTDKKGYGCKLVTKSSDGEVYYYADYIRINANGTVSVIVEDTASPGYQDNNFNSVFNKLVYSVHFSEGTVILGMYGDVRYEDGTQAPTDDEYIEQPTYDFSNATDSELDELLQELKEELERQNPDLSTMEGLLESIYYRLGSLDSDNDNALLSDINLAIVSLMKSNDENTQELVNALFEIRDGLKNEDSGTSDEESEETTESDHPNHICGTLYNVKPLDKNWLTKLFTDVTELRVEYQGNKYYLETCGCLLIDDKYYSVDMNYDSYTSIDYDFSNEDIESGFDLADGSSVFDFEWGSEFDGSSAVSTFGLRRLAPAGFLEVSEVFDATQKTKLNGIVDMVRKGLDVGVPFNVLMDSVKSFEGILFTTSEPQDLVITIFDTEVTILSAKFFGTADHSIVTGGIDRGGGGASGSLEELYVTNETMSIVRDLSSVFIGVAWVLNMRRKVTNMI